MEEFLASLQLPRRQDEDDIRRELERDYLLPKAEMGTKWLAKSQQ
jgi:hypothetical protein